MTYPLNVIEIETALDALALSHPAVTELITLPNRTWEGRETHALRIGPPGAKGGDTLIIVGGLHGNEWVPPDALVNLAADLLEAHARGTGLRYGQQRFTAAEIRILVEEQRLVLFPCVNPDGRHHSQTVSAPWRKNRRPTNEGIACMGVDINRNFEALWHFRRHFAEDAGVHSSDDPCDPLVYVGPAPASEPETRNVVALLDRYPQTRWFVDLHSAVPAIFFTWGFDVNQTTDPSMSFRNAAFDGQRGRKKDIYREFIPADDHRALQQLGDRINDAIVAASGADYGVEQSYSLYPTSGCSDDFAYGRHFVRPDQGKILSFTIECGKRQQPVTLEEAENVIREVCAGLIALCVAARDRSAEGARDAEKRAIAGSMAGVIDRLRQEALQVRSHARQRVGGQLVSWWFDENNASTREFMEALAGDSLLVVPGEPGRSKLVTEFLKPSRPMGDTLGADVGIIREWIAADCPLPVEVPIARI